MNVVNLVGVDLEERDIDTAHRLKSRNTVLPPPFAIKMVNGHRKIETMRKVTKVKPTAERLGGDKAVKIYFNDLLTPEKQRILNNTKGLWDYFIVWCRNMEIFS